MFTDSKVETEFVKELDTSSEGGCLCKVAERVLNTNTAGSYNPDWAISFKEGTVKHVYFIAETKGTTSSLQLKEIKM